MQYQDQAPSKQAQPSSQQAPAAMQVLTVAELREVVGGPIIDNGVSLTNAYTTGSNG